MKKAFFTLFPLFLLVAAALLYLFSPKELTPEKILEKVRQKEKKITGYYTLLETVINTGSSEQSYYVEVWFESPHFYRVEIYSSLPEGQSLPEQVFVSNGEKTWIFSPEINDFYELNPLSKESASPPFLLATFLQNLSQARDLELLGLEQKDSGFFYLLRFPSPAPGRRSAWEKVWLERGTFLPAQIEIYDYYDQLQQRIIFHKTVINPPLDPDLFKI